MNDDLQTYIEPELEARIVALVLGEALRSHATEHPYILLTTNDVPDDWKPWLEEVGWQLREVEYIDGDHYYFAGPTGRFSGVFTKLHAINLTEFAKIALLLANKENEQN